MHYHALILEELHGDTPRKKYLSLMNMKTQKPNGKWTKEQIENFLRHETMMSDHACKRLASQLSKGSILNLLIGSEPEDYTEQYE